MVHVNMAKILLQFLIVLTINSLKGRIINIRLSHAFNLSRISWSTNLHTIKQKQPCKTYLIFSYFSLLEAVSYLRRGSVVDWIPKTGPNNPSHLKKRFCVVTLELSNERRWLFSLFTLDYPCHLLAPYPVAQGVWLLSWLARGNVQLALWALGMLFLCKAVVVLCESVSSHADDSWCRLTWWKPKLNPSRQPSAVATRESGYFETSSHSQSPAWCSYVSNPGWNHIEKQGCAARPCLATWPQNQQQMKWCFLSPSLLWCSWHTTLCEFKAYCVLTWYTHIF